MNRDDTRQQEPDREMLVRLYWNEELSSIQIARRFGLTLPTVLRLMASYRIPRRKASGRN